jgi:hypothetical protein
MDFIAMGDEYTIERLKTLLRHWTPRPPRQAVEQSRAEEQEKLRRFSQSEIQICGTNNPASVLHVPKTQEER